MKLSVSDKVRLAVDTLNGGLKKFISNSQRSAILYALRGEEAEFFADKINALGFMVAEEMPVTYQSDKKEPLAYLHYFMAGADWWISEKDVEGDTPQAFGKADLFQDGGELGYISIDELVASGVELDLYWTVKPLRDCE